MHLLYLHGVGDPDSANENWRSGLAAGLALNGHPDLGDLPVLAPKYGAILASPKLPKRDLPPRTAPSQIDSHVLRGQYEVNQAALRRLLGTGGQLFAGRMPDVPAAANIAMSVGLLRQAKVYASDSTIRATVLETVLQSLPDAPVELVIVSHSLGTLVAIDLLDHLPDGVTVKQLVTMGSPAGMRGMHSKSGRLLQDFPYGRVASWLNVVSPWDVVTGGHGVGQLFPAAHDAVVKLGAGRHDSVLYLSQGIAAKAIGAAIFGSEKEDTEIAPRVPPAPSDGAHAADVAVFAIACAHVVADELAKRHPKEGSRYRAALAVVQDEVAQKLSEVGRADSDAAGRLLGDGTPPPIDDRWLSQPDLILQLLILAATTNLIAPYVLKESQNDELIAAGVIDIAQRLGVSMAYGKVVTESLKAAREVLEPSALRAILLGAAGVSAVLAGTVGVMLTGPGGLAGAAAITSALAGFGPGGMVGGMALAGALVGGGAATTASSVWLANAPVAVVEAEVVRRMTHAKSRRDLDMPDLVDDWVFLVRLESEVASELTRHEGISDGSAPIVKQAERKVKLLRKAIDWMVESGLSSPQIGD